MRFLPQTFKKNDTKANYNASKAQCFWEIKENVWFFSGLEVREHPGYTQNNTSMGLKYVSVYNTPDIQIHLKACKRVLFKLSLLTGARQGQLKVADQEDCDRPKT